ncbi:MAG: ABC transporter permease [Sneathiellales bacterium]|nr:ABC transporter permease [Sneathiellales bacterium]
MRLIRIMTTFIGLIALWAVIAKINDLPKFILPSPQDVLISFSERYDILFQHSLTTALEIGLGLFFGIIGGIISALLISMYQPVRQWVMPLLIASQALPVFAIAPLLVLWFDYGITSKVVMATLIIYFPVTVGFSDGLNRTPTAWRDMAAVIQAGSTSRISNQIRQYRYIRIPFALPSLASGIRVATAVAPIGAVVGEWVGSSSGLGYLMLHANGRMQTDLMFAALLILTLMAVSLYYLMDFCLRKAINWQTDQNLM